MKDEVFISMVEESACLFWRLENDDFKGAMKSDFFGRSLLATSNFFGSVKAYWSGLGTLLVVDGVNLML